MSARSIRRRSGIFSPERDGDEWLLVSEFPGQQDWRLYGDGPEALKKGAEAWLEDFVSSLGAIFPEDSAVTQDDEMAAVQAGEDDR